MQTSEELIAAALLIGDRTYRIKVAIKDEEAVRKTVKIINEKIIEFKTQFAGKDMQDYIAMVLLWYATEQSNATSRTLANASIDSRLSEIEKTIDGVIS